MQPGLLARLLVLIILLGASNVGARDFGKQGMTFEVREEGFVAMIQRRLKNINISSYEEKMSNIAKARIEEPLPNTRIGKATKTFSYNFDPTYMLDKDIYLPGGKLLYAKGTKVNPLDRMTWEGKLVFIDGRDQEQVAWVKKHHIGAGNKKAEKDSEQKNISDSAKENMETKIVLIAGRPLDLERETGKPVYFDQSGELVTRFKIGNVPAVVEQDGKYLKISEINTGAK